MAEITTGQQLNSYRGDAALGGSAEAGYAPLDLSPLGVYALKKYETNVINFEQQQKDKKVLQEKFTDPTLYLYLDKNYADQLDPDLEELKELSKQNLHMDPNSEGWYDFHNKYNKALRKSAALKTAQALKDEYKKKLEGAADVHEKERLDGYIKQLDGWKVGQEIPAYSGYFKYDDKHIVSGESAKIKSQRTTPDGKIQTVETVFNNPAGLDKLTARMLVTDPTSAQTYSDIAHTFQDTDILDKFNESVKDVYQKGRNLAIGNLGLQYKKEFDDYKKQYPNGTFSDFLVYTGKDGELKKINDSYEYLNPKPNANGDVVYLVAGEQKELSGYTYSVNEKGEKTRLNVPDYIVGAMMGATKNPPGERETIIDEKFSITPKDRFEADQKAKLQAAELAQKRAELAEKKRQFNIKNPDLKLPNGEFGNLIYGVNADNIKVSSRPNIAAIKNGTIVDKDGNVLKGESGDIVIPASAFNNSIVTEYNKYAGEKAVTQTKGQTTDEETGNTTTVTTTQTQLAGQIDLSTGYLKAKFENGVIKGIYAKNRTLIDDDMFEQITKQAGSKGAPNTGYGTQPEADAGKPAWAE